jgi:hypothetical protein
LDFHNPAHPDLLLWLWVWLFYLLQIKQEADTRYLPARAAKLDFVAFALL